MIIARKILLGSSASIALLLPFAHAMAQEAPSSPPAANSAADDKAVGEIVVTAQKRSETLSKVGLTIAAFSGDQLKQQGLSNVQDLTKIVPGLTFSKGLFNSPVYTLRGVGFYDTSLAVLPAVTVYVDQVPLTFPVLTTQAGLDVERVEVLKGPQGTLFGQNSTGGAINYIAAKPTDELKAGFDLSYGRFKQVEAGGFVSGPITDTLKARVAVKAVRSDDWQRGYTADTSTGATRSFAARLLVNWEPVDSVRLTLNLNAWNDHSDPQAGQYYQLAPQSPVVLPDLINYPKAPNNARAADITPGFEPRTHSNAKQAALNAEIDLTDSITLTSLSSYVRYKQRNRLDPDGMTLEAYHLDSDIGSIKSLSQELRISNSADNALKWVLGGSYENHKISQDTVQSYGNSSVASSYNFFHNGFFNNQKMENYAFFGNVDYALNDQFSIKIGARHTNTKTDYESCTYDVGDGLAAAFFNATSQALRGAFGLGPTAPTPAGGCIQLSPLTTLADGSYDPNSYQPNHIFYDRQKEKNTSWRIGVDYKPVDGLLFYVNVAKGYKAGGYPQVTTSTDSQFEPVKQESVIDYEGGFKAQLFDRTMSLSGAVFYYDYKNKQLRGKVIDPIFGALDKLLNIPKASLKGAELSLAWRPVTGLIVSGSGTYVDGKVKKFTGVNGSGVTADFAGTPIPLSPKWQFATSIDYEFPIAGDTQAFIGASTSYNSKTYGVIGGGTLPTVADPDPANMIKDYFLLDLRAGLRLDDDKLSLTVWGKNITNTYYWYNAVQIYDQKVRYTGKPATYGATLSFRY